MAVVAKTPIAQPRQKGGPDYGDASAAAPAPKGGAPRKRAPAAAPKGRARATRPAPKVASGTLPGWGELGMAPMARRTGRLERFADRLPARRFYLALLVFLCVVVAYVGHIFATKQLYRDLQTARAENLQLHLKHNRLSGELDAATAPSVVVGRARALGLEEGMAYGPTIGLAR